MKENDTSYFDPHEQHIHSRTNRRVSRYSQMLLFYWYKYVLRKRIYCIQPWISMSWGKVEHNNWGDDINMFFLKKITNDAILPQKAIALPKNDIIFHIAKPYPPITCIGSIFHLIDEKETIVWGSGLLTANHLPSVHPKKILAVRGPLTRKTLIENDFDCPEVYGDPALLLPYYYKPIKREKYKLGIIAHYTDFNKDEVQQFSNQKDVIIIRLFNYRNWKDVINQICSCQFIASSSLHGLIAAEAYNIPNLWVEFNEPLTNDITKRFKFHDFFQSIGQDRELPFPIFHGTSINDVMNLQQNYIKAPGLSLIPLVESCPFTIKKTIRKKIQ